MSDQLPPIEAAAAPRDPEELEATAPARGTVLPAELSLGAVHLTVADLERSLDYYRRAIGLELLAQDEAEASLGTGSRELLRLVERPGARPAFGRTGLYHFALLVPRRPDLAAWLAHAARDRVQLVGLSDHFVSEALYLSDPDGHGIEIYCDRPRSVWEGKVDVRMTTQPLDVDDLFAELDDPATAAFSGLPEGTVMGHVHLRVAEIAPTVQFYRDVLGFDLMAQLGSRAAFLAAGGYHHHIGANTWESAGAPPPDPDMAALRHATIVLPDAAARDTLVERVSREGIETHTTDSGPAVLDPSGNTLVLDVAG
jgi:catechol 2,3-dioxygenase